MNKFANGMKFDVRFTFNRFPLRNMHRAVADLGKSDSLLDVIFPKKEEGHANAKKRSSGEPAKPPQHGFYNRKVGSNPEQARAVCQIINGAGSSTVGEALPPYIVFGPPGTGKTVTMVEALVQLYKTAGEKRPLLACAPSNSAADLLATRLLEVVPKSDLHRHYAPSRQMKQVPEAVFEVSSFASSRADMEVHHVAAKFRIIVTTLVTAGRLVTYGVPRGHFSHVFVDEAGQAMEPEAIIPLAGLIDPLKTRLVLAGDPKQLGPIVRSPVALRGGLQVYVQLKFQLRI